MGSIRKSKWQKLYPSIRNLKDHQRRLMDAIRVVVLDSAIKSYLKQSDPQALKQLEDALKTDKYEKEGIY